MSETVSTPTPADVTPKAPEPAAATPKPDELPADHPLVKSLAAQKDEIRALKERVGEKATADERIAELEQKYSNAESARLRAEVAGAFGISTKKGPNGEPSDAELFLTGADEATLTKQAERLAARTADLKKQGNVAPLEGGNSSGAGNGDMREFARNLFANTD